MARKRISMNKVREIIRLYTIKVSRRKISTVVNVSRPVVSDYIEKFLKSGLCYKQIQDLNDDELLRVLECNKAKRKKKYEYLRSKFEHFTKELKRKGVTLLLLWEEYKAEYAEGYSRSQFCYHYNVWRKESKLYMSIEHKAGDKMYVDFTGHKMKIFNRQSRRFEELEVFIAILGASQLTYVEVTTSQKKENWIRANKNAFEYFGGATGAIVPDCLKSAITKACKYEPDVNPDYQDFAQHYGTVILPARPGRPKDKALVEGAVKIAYTRIFAPLRDEIFYSVNELNEAIKKLLEKHNNIPMQRINVSRLTLFEETERAALIPLPLLPYEQKKFQQSTVQFNYHIYLKEDARYYSVPHRYSGKVVKVRYNWTVVEIFYKNERIAIHTRASKEKRYNTIPEHMPPNHRWLSDWNPDKFTKWALNIGLNVRDVIVKILERHAYPEQAYKVCLGILNLPKQKDVSKDRLDQACKRALHYGLFSYKGIRNILKNNLENAPIEDDLFAGCLPQHNNIRGSFYYTQGVGGPLRGSKQEDQYESTNK